MNKLNFLIVISATVFAAVLMPQWSCQAASVSAIENFKDQFIPKEYQKMNFTLDDLKNVYREKCKKASGVDNSTLYQEIEKSANTLMKCVSTLANITAIQEEIELARPLGELDGVFHKYCSKVPEAQKCVKTFNEKVQPCLTLEEKLQNGVMMRVATNLMGFMCDKGGDQIALFVAEEGPECLEANKEAIGHCLNSSFAQYLPKDGSVPSVMNMPELVLAPEHCLDFEKFEACTVHHLEQCQEITPANVIQSMFKFIKNETNCKTYLFEKANERSVLIDPRSAATSNSVLGVAAIGAIAIMLLERFM